MRPFALTGALLRQPGRTLGLGRMRLQEMLSNLGFRLAGGLTGERLPPGRLVEQVIGSRLLAFYDVGGMLMARSIVTILRRNRTPIHSFDTILDFGCGCGRVIRWLARWRRGANYWGCDYNPDLVEWCQAHLAHVGRFRVNEANPPLPFDDATFDLVYSYSVFTHLSAGQQRPWMKELARVLKPGGRLLITLHGRRVAWREGLSAAQLKRLDEAGVLVLGGERSGTNDCAAFHASAWMRDHEPIGLELIDHLEGGASDGSEQDICLYRAVDNRSQVAAG